MLLVSNPLQVDLFLQFFALQQIYRLMRALPYTLAVLMKLNYVPPPPPPVEQEVVEQVVDPKKAAAAAKKPPGKK